MAGKSELFYSALVGDLRPITADQSASSRRDLLEIAIVFFCILIAVWTPQGKLNAFFSIVAAACVVAFAIAGRWGASDLGLTRPFSGLGLTLLTGAILCGAVALMGVPLRFVGRTYSVPLVRSWQYAIWALEHVPFGEKMINFGKRFKDSLKEFVVPTMIWEELGFVYH